jgi:hypothetical protein
MVGSDDSALELAIVRCESDGSGFFLAEAKTGTQTKWC